jgi:hypothetical protein
MASFEEVSNDKVDNNDNVDNNEDETELLYLALSAYWIRNETSITNWWLTTLNDETRRNVLLQTVPDMPLNPNKDATKVTDRILPELTLSVLLACDGKLLILFVKRRFSTEDCGFQGDAVQLTKMFTDGDLPNLGGEKLDQMDLPFVDPCDPDENIRSLSKNTSPEARLQIMSHLSTCRLVHAAVWLCLRIRRSTIAGFLTNLILIHEESMSQKPSPSFQELLRGEREQANYLGQDETELLKESEKIKVNQKSTLEECD